MLMSTALLLGTILSTLGSGLVTYLGNATNARSQELINQQNIAAQKEINEQNIEYSREFAQNGISWKVQDLQNAGLNPVLAAGMSGNNAQPTAMSSVQQKAPIIDLSGISSAITAMNNMMLTSYLMQNRNDIQADRNQVMREKNNVLQGLYQRKASMFDSKTAGSIINSSKQLKEMQKAQEKAMTPAEKAKWTRLLHQLEKFEG